MFWGGFGTKIRWQKTFLHKTNFFNTILIAHSKQTYGSFGEAKDVSYLKRLVGVNDLIDPSQFENAGKKASQIMSECLNIIKSDEVDCLVVRELDGAVGAGVYAEVKLALDLGKDVFVLREDPKLGYYFVKVTGVRRVGNKVETFFGVISTLPSKLLY